MQVTTSTQNENTTGERKHLTMAAYLDARILATYDSSAKEREAHDKMMENYRRYLMKLCTVSNEAAPSIEGDEE